MCCLPHLVPISYTIVSQTFMLPDPCWFRKIITDPHTLAHVNIDCPVDRYTEINIYISEVIILILCLQCTFFRLTQKIVNNELLLYEYCICIESYHMHYWCEEWWCLYVLQCPPYL